MPTPVNYSHLLDIAFPAAEFFSSSLVFSEKSVGRSPLTLARISRSLTRISSSDGNWCWSCCWANDAWWDEWSDDDLLPWSTSLIGWCWGPLRAGAPRPEAAAAPTWCSRKLRKLMVNIGVEERWSTLEESWTTDSSWFWLSSGSCFSLRWCSLSALTDSTTNLRVVNHAHHTKRYTQHPIDPSNS